VRSGTLTRSSHTKLMSARVGILWRCPECGWIGDWPGLDRTVTSDPAWAHTPDCPQCLAQHSLRAYFPPSTSATTQKETVSYGPKTLPEAPPQQPYRFTDHLPKVPKWIGGGFIGLAVALVIIIGTFGSHGSSSTPTDTTPSGSDITNARVVAGTAVSTEVQFDFKAQAYCGHLRFTYAFYDAAGNSLYTADGTTTEYVSAGVTYHVTADGFRYLPGLGEPSNVPASSVQISHRCEG
jgi:hypothetical protein